VSKDKEKSLELKTNIDPRHLLHVRAIARAKSFAQASRNIGLSQPALSRSVAVLEDRLGTKVFDRFRTGAVLNAAGHILLRNADGLVDMLNRTAEEVQLAAKAMRGPLTVGATSGVLLKFLPDVMKELHRHEESMQMMIETAPADELLSGLEVGHFDLIICPVHGTLVPSKGIEQEALFDDPFSIAYGPAGKFDHGDEVLINDLIDKPWVLPGPGGNYIQSLFEVAHLPKPMNCITTNNLSLVISIVQATNRITIVSRTGAFGFGPTLTKVPIKNSGSRMIGFMRRSVIRPSPLAERMIDVLREISSRAPYKID
jgi:DNA-binding transcriptional LysR family regulator